VNSRQQIVLIGTASSLTQLCQGLTLTASPPFILGAFLPSVTDPTVLQCPLLGHLDELEDGLRRALSNKPVDRVLVSFPCAMAETARRTVDLLDRMDLPWRFIPTLDDQLADRASFLAAGKSHDRDDSTLSQVFAYPSPIDPAALLDRDPFPLDEPPIRECLQGKAVMITGAGGSIGSALAYSVARFIPACLVLVERSENALFQVQRDISRLFPDLPIRARLHDVTHRASTQDLIAECRPHVIFHAAAHKHVPMMEEHPCHAVENNFYGTVSVAEAAHTSGTEKFVLISTDKAVNPSSVMGATKRLAELYVRDLDARSQTRFAAVRFGNVLGSACSVLPIWTSQIAHGGPITVTHPEMRRYFMTIPEATGLVLQAAANCRQTLQSGAGSCSLIPPDNVASTDAIGPVFLFEMGRPVRVADLASRFIRAHGLKPDVDIRIVYTGARPGEKMSELLTHDTEDIIPTSHPAIYRCRSPQPGPSTVSGLIRTFDELRNRDDEPARIWSNTQDDEILSALRDTLPEMQSVICQ